uniref:Sulfotransfer_1 domain-containing protein n=1 Tax=Macrostomum lignano TaxID=282301 RepID=A0A1I8FK98_9PLAT
RPDPQLQAASSRPAAQSWGQRRRTRDSVWLVVAAAGPPLSPQLPNTNLRNCGMKMSKTNAHEVMAVMKVSIIDWLRSKIVVELVPIFSLTPKWVPKLLLLTAFFTLVLLLLHGGFNSNQTPEARQNRVGPTTAFRATARGLSTKPTKGPVQPLVKGMKCGEVQHRFPDSMPPYGLTSGRLVVLHHVGGMLRRSGRWKLRRDLSPLLMPNSESRASGICRTALWSQEPPEHAAFIFNRPSLISNAVMMSRANHSFLNYVVNTWPAWFEANWAKKRRGIHQAIHVTGPGMLQNFYDKYAGMRKAEATRRLGATR